MRGFELSNMKLKGVHLRGVPLSGIGTPHNGGAAGLPPEIKAALVAWYSPKRSALNNFNVIESYAEDFNTWSYNSSRGTLTRTPSKLVITDVLQNGLNIIEDVSTPFDDIKVRITGVTSENVMTWKTDLGGASVSITQDGIYTLPSGRRYYGFRFAQLGAVNVTIEQLPTSTLDDLSGNGHTLYLKGFKGKLGSGMGLYGADFMSWAYITSHGTLTRTPSKVIITEAKKANVIMLYTENPPYNAINIRVSGVTEDNPLRVNTTPVTIIRNDGVYNIQLAQYVGFSFGMAGAVNVTVEQIPDYPDQLCHDGTCYGISYGQPILTDYTVVANRTWFDTSLANKMFASKRLTDNSAGAFLFEKVNGSLQQTSTSFGDTKVITFATGVSYQTKTSYNGSVLVPSTTTDSNILVIGGSVLSGAATEFWKGCYSDFMLFNRTLTPEEIAIVKKFIT